MRPVIFIHGFQSGAESSKWIHLQTVPDIDPHLVSVDYVHDSPSDVLEKIYQVDDRLNDAIFIGHSLGGLFALYAGAAQRRQTILLNPSLLPLNTLGDKLWRFRLQYQVLQDAVAKIQHHTASVTLVETGDTVVDWKSQAKYLPNVIYIPGGDHRFQSLNMINSTIEQLNS